MLLTFSVENFQSIRDRQTLSMIRVGGGTKTRLAIDGDPACGDVSPVAAIFGANASGKTTIIDAMGYVMWLVRNSALGDATRPLPMEPFLLDDQSQRRPFACEVCFVTDEREFVYSFTLQSGLVQSEELKETVQGEHRRATRTLFSRTADGRRAEVTVSNLLKGPKRAIINATRPNSLFLSKAAQENFEPLMDVYNWFADPTTTVSHSRHFVVKAEPGVSRMENDPDYRSWVTELLTAADLGVTSVSIELPRTRPPKDLVSFVAETADPDELARVEDEVFQASRHPVLSHRADLSDQDEAPIPWNRESTGTRELWDLANEVYHSLKTGRALILDEMTGLHPLLVRTIVETFQSARTNPNGAQLIFTSHDVSLLGSWAGQGYMLDRDQVWFTEKDYFTGATSLIPLTDFGPRKDEDTERMYIQGRFGAVPSLTGLPEVSR